VCPEEAPADSQGSNSSTLPDFASPVGWPSSPRPSSPSLPPCRREKREKAAQEGPEAPLSRRVGGRLGERGWGSEGQPRRGGSLRPESPGKVELSGAGKSCYLNPTSAAFLRRYAMVFSNSTKSAFFSRRASSMTRTEPRTSR
jgi:hypothetical protein